MMILIVFSLIAVLGVRGEDDCTPACSRNIDFAMNLLRFEKALAQVGNGLPSNEFFQENCDFLVEFLKCYRQGCGLRHVMIDLDAAVDVAIEFCDEKSALRKAYVDNIDCFSGTEFTEDTCVSSVLRTTEVEIFNYEIRESLEKNSIDRLCIFFYFFMTCAVDVTTETCGKEAGRAAVEITTRAMDIVLCSPDEMDFFDSILDFFEAAESSRQCDSSTAACSGGDEIMDIIEAQKEFPSEEDLKKHCNALKKGLNCPAKKAKECGEPDNKETVSAYEKLLEVLNDICEESSAFRASYLRSVSCYKSILNKFSACSYNIKADINRFMISEAYSPLPFGTKAPLKYTCMTIDLIPNCQIREAADNCGVEAAGTLGRLLFSLKKLYLSMSCKKPHMAIWRDEYLTYLMNDEEEEC